ncbi:MAG: C39 family peptidase [Anaerolineales bacterium]|nr:C39 family peptidase [Anaerolineales bacterium]
MSVLLNLAYKSQYDADAAASRNDCGPACLAMLVNALGVAATTDAVFHRTGAAAQGYISMAQIMRAAESYQAPLEFRKGWGLGQLRALLDLARPAIALVHYGAFVEVQPGLATQSQFTGPHFLLVVGYDEQQIVVHDPLWTGARRGEGAFKRWPNSVFLSAWSRCHEDCDASGRCNPDQAMLISVRPLNAVQRVSVPADLVRRMRAKAALLSQPPPPPLTPATTAAAVRALGNWGKRTVAHRVTATDTLWRLADAYYGDGRKLTVIQYFNGLDETDVIHDGQVLLIPEPLLSGQIREDRRPTGVTPAAPPPTPS